MRSSWAPTLGARRVWASIWAAHRRPLPHPPAAAQIRTRRRRRPNRHWPNGAPRGLRRRQRPRSLSCGRAGGASVSGWVGTRAGGWGWKDAVDRSPVQRPGELLGLQKEIGPRCPPCRLLGSPFSNSCLHRNCPWGLTVCGPLSPDPRLSSGMNRERFFLFRASFGACVLPPRPTSSFGTLREAENVH